MNRDIKFRGKDIDLGIWVYGDLLQYNGGDVAIGTHGTFIDDGYHFNEHWDRCAIVDEETVGMFIGLKDCNGIDIYEGDIVERKETKSDYYPAQPGICREHPETRSWVETHRYCVTFNIVPRIGGFDMLCTHRDANKLSVIGNIHDNPELMEK